MFSSAAPPQDTVTALPATGAVGAAVPPMPAIRTQWVDALALVNPAQHTIHPERITWTRTAAGLEAQPHDRNVRFSGTCEIPLALPASYAIEAEFSATVADGSYGIVIPAGDRARTACWITGWNGNVGIGKVDGLDPGNHLPGLDSPFRLEPGRRYLLRGEVRRVPEK